MSGSVFSRLDSRVLESEYARWRVDAASVDPVWAAFFEGFELGSEPGAEDSSGVSASVGISSSEASGVTRANMSVGSSALVGVSDSLAGSGVVSVVGSDMLSGAISGGGEVVVSGGTMTGASPGVGGAVVDAASSEFRGRVALMVFAYRAVGHFLAWVDPLSPERPSPLRLSTVRFGFTKEDLKKHVNIHMFRQGETQTLWEIVTDLRKCYCGYTGFEFMHINTIKIRNWIQKRIEERINGVDYGPEYARLALRWLLEAQLFESFLGKKFLGEKRFSLEGGEGLLVILNALLEAAPENGVCEFEMGMAHRGRLNVLANFLRKSLGTILYEFTPNYMPDIVEGDGDVKYHLGYEKMRHVNGHEVRLSLAANPSHLEAVDPVVEGKARARQRFLEDEVERKKVVPLLIHGDAAFAGQGLVAEVFNLSQLQGYRTGGTIHVIVNNQIGFTTTPQDARSSKYATDIAKMVEAPILHVNGEQPMELIWAAFFALEFRQKYGRDVVIDMYCYRRQGHNENDQTAFTSPTLARRIEKRTPIGEMYARRLIEEGVMTESEVDRLELEIWGRMEEEYQTMLTRSALAGKDAFSGSTARPQPPFNFEPVDTGISQEKLRHIGKALVDMPEGFNLHATLANRFIPRRKTILESGEGFDWAIAESLAWGSLLMEGNPVRLSGQDCRRGTFSQRHGVFYDYETRDRYIPLKHLSKDQARFRIFNSSLSEASVLGFEYGYSLGCPEMLTMWEAQFGDFANGAQVIIDQFIVSAESKWQTPSSIVLLLPHGYDGQGAEHSSARLERFLQLCAEDNIQVMNLTTPAQYFHALRRQKRRDFVKPLILMTPKSMLTRPEAVSKESDFLEGTCFREILPDEVDFDPAGVTRVIFCSGKVYYDLVKERADRAITDTIIIRLEQIYPLHREMLKDILSPYANLSSYIWCQEEPENMGAWHHIHYPLSELFNVRIRYSGRHASPSPAEGAKVMHYAAQKKLVAQAFEL